MGILQQGSGTCNVSPPRESAVGRDAPIPSTHDGFLPPGSGARGAPDSREDDSIHGTDPHGLPIITLRRLLSRPVVAPVTVYRLPIRLQAKSALTWPVV